MRIAMGVVAATAIVGAAVGVSAAQAPAPTVTITASETSLTAAPGPVAPGATRFEFTSTAEKAEMGVFVASPKPGRTVDEVIAALRTNPDTSLEIADIVASASLAPGGKRAVTAEILAGRSYLLVNDVGKENSAQWIITPLATGGTPTGATAPEPDAQVMTRDLRFVGDRTLPRNGTIRIRNIGWAPHFAVAAPLKKSAGRGAVGRAIVGNRERELGRLLDFRNAIELTNILTRGATADNEVTFAKRGRYVLVCFFENHNAQGMYRFVRVR